MAAARQRVQDYRYDICLSFAGEDRKYVDKVADDLRAAGVRVFYDLYEKVDLWGKDLYIHLDDIYGKAARYCVIFVSRHYARKLWTKHERAAAQARALQSHHDYVLPARFDDTKIPGLRDTVGFIDLRKTAPSELARLIAKKVGAHQRQNYLPPIPDMLFRAHQEEFGPVDKELLYKHASHFLEALRRTNPEERDALIVLLQETCPANLPKKVHMNVDLLTRATGTSVSGLERMFAGLRSLGFYTRFRKGHRDKHHIGEDQIIEVEWHDLHTVTNATAVAFLMMAASDYSHCPDCAAAALRRLDFSHLSTATLTGEALEVGSRRRIPHIGKELKRLFPLDEETTAASVRAARKRPSTRRSRRA